MTFQTVCFIVAVVVLSACCTAPVERRQFATWSKCVDANPALGWIEKCS